MSRMPERTREYRSYIFDSRNWDGFRPRARRRGDLDLLQVRHHLDAEHRAPAGVPAPAAPGGRRRSRPGSTAQHDDPTPMLAGLEAQRHRRIVKSHLPLDALPYYPEVRYIVVVRDPRDVFMSFWNHYSEIHRRATSQRSTAPGLAARRCRAARTTSTTLAALDRPRLVPLGERGLAALRQPLPHRLLVALPPPPNILFVHFADLLADLPAEIGRIARFLGIPLTPDEAAALAAEVRFEALRANAAGGRADAGGAGGLRLEGRAPHLLPSRHQRPLARGAGPGGADALRGGEGALPEPDCAAYLEGGRAAWSEPAPSRSAKAASTAA